MDMRSASAEIGVVGFVFSLMTTVFLTVGKFHPLYQRSRGKKRYIW